MAKLKSFQRIVVVDMDHDEFFEQFDLDLDDDVEVYAFVVGAEEVDEDFGFPFDHVIYMNKEDAERDEVYVQVLAHEYGHIFNQVFGFEDTEDAADDFAFDVLSELGMDTEVFHHWAHYNQEEIAAQVEAARANLD